MQTSESPHPLLTAVFQWVATILGSGVLGIFFKDWLDKRRERRKALNEADVNDARVRSLDGETVGGASERMIKLFDVIYKLNEDVASERRRANEAEVRASNEESRRKHLELELEQAEKNVYASVTQMQQLHAAASLQEVSIANHQPADLKKEIGRLFPERWPPGGDGSIEDSR